MDALPDETLSEIFKYLPLESRKTARLVCYRWFDLQNNTFFLKKEVLVFKADYDIVDISKLLIASKRRIFYLEFHWCNFEEYTLSFLENFCMKIRELKFLSCFVIDEHEIEKVLDWCRELTHLSIISLFCFYTKRSEYAVFSDLAARGITREKLEYFLMEVSDFQSITRAEFNDFFQIFPNHKTFGIGCFTFGNDFGCSSFPRKPSNKLETIKVALSCLLQHINQLRNQIECLILEFENPGWSEVVNPEYPNLIRQVVTVISSLHKLNDLSVTMPSGNVVVADIFEPILNLKNMKSLNFTLDSEKNASTFNFDLRIFESFSMLRHLCLDNLRIQPALSVALFKSNLETLILTNVFLCRFSLDDISQNLSVRYLNIKFSNWQKIAKIHQFILCFGNLRHLSVNVCNDFMFQSICKNLKQLQSLVISCSEDCLREIQHENQRENRVEGNSSLSLLHLSSNVNLKTLAPVLLPNVKYLNLSNDTGIMFLNRQHFLAFIRDIHLMSQLQILKVSCQQSISSAVCLELCAKLPELRFLQILTVCAFDRRDEDSEYEKLFNKNPSLRVFSQDGLILRYDIFKQKVMKLDSILGVFYSPKISSYRINWID